MSGLDKLIARRRRPEQDGPVTGQAPADLLEVPYDPVAHQPEGIGMGHGSPNGHGTANGHTALDSDPAVNGDPAINGDAAVNGHTPVSGDGPVDGHDADRSPSGDAPAATATTATATTATARTATVETAAVSEDTPPDAEEPARPNLRQRGRVRRRARYLRRLRELQLRDIGGLAVELHRFNRRRQDLIDLKVAAAAETAEELRALERLLAENRPVGELRQAGIGGACARCGAIHGSLDRFCSACGAALEEAPGLEEHAAG